MRHVILLIASIINLSIHIRRLTNLIVKCLEGNFQFGEFIIGNESLLLSQNLELIDNC